MSSIGARILILIDALGINKNRFSVEIGTSSAMISKITNGNVNFGVDIIERIISTYPQLNIDWLLTGVGEIWIDNHKLDVQQLTQESEKKSQLEKGSKTSRDAKNQPLGMSYEGFYDENKQDFYYRHPEKRINKLLSVATNDFKQAFNDYYKLITVSNNLGAPDFIREKFSTDKTFKEIKKDIDDELTETHEEIDDKFYFKCIRLVAYESEIEHCHNLVSQLIYYMDLYVDFYAIKETNDKKVTKKI